jgi:antitoxin component of MazEF toxin-antitoxin module
MTRRKTGEKNIRKIFKNGSSYAVTIPLEIVKKLKIRKGQKVVVRSRGEGISIKDWVK